MAIDMSRIDRTILENSIRQAQRLQDAGRYADAAHAWQQAAAHADTYAERAAGKEERDRRRATAEEFRRIADLLLQPKTKEPEVTAGTPDDANEYRQAAARLITHSGVRFDDIAGLSQTKNELKLAYALGLAAAPEGVVLPRTRNILFYGPPGCGKTLLAAAVSHSLQATFFNVKVGDLTSKYFGESSRLVQAVYDEARSHGNSVVFLDECDALAGNRNASDNGAERRLLTSLLTELDGLGGKDDDAHVITIAATNSPWSLDEAIISRFEKQVLIPLPDLEARQQIISLQLIRQGYSLDCNLDELAERTAGLSGREIEHLTRLMKEQMIADENQELLKTALAGQAAVRAATVSIAPLTQSDFQTAVTRIKPAMNQKEIARYADWGRRQNS